MKDAQQDVPVTVLRACITAILLYGLPDPRDHLGDSAGRHQGQGRVGVPRRRRDVFTVYGGAADVMIKIAAVMFILAVVSSACTWLMGSDRSQAVACYDGAGPRILGNFSAKLGTPINVNFLSGVFSTIVFIIASRLTSGSAAYTFNGDDRCRAHVHDDLVHRDLPVPRDPADVSTRTSIGRTRCRAA